LLKWRLRKKIKRKCEKIEQDATDPTGGETHFYSGDNTPDLAEKSFFNNRRP